MNRKIQLIILACCTLVLGACNSWLDVKPYDKIAEDDLLNSEDGYQKLLNGVYIELNDDNLYGNALMVEMIEVMGGCYEVGNEALVWKDYADLINYTYSTEYWRGRFDKTWEKAYALIMNCNKILDNMEKHKELFTETNYDIIRGEALALRAMLHFDMLRLFGPVYRSNPDDTSIPYYLHQSTVVNDLLPAKQVIRNVITDLLEAEKALANDPIITRGTLMSGSTGNETNFPRYRALRLNYYAVQGLLARAYLYAGEKANAFSYADKVIKVAESGKFPFVQRTQVKRDRIFSTEILFALTNVKRVLLFKNMHDPARSPENIFTMDAQLLDLIYTKAASSSRADYRYEANWRSSAIPGMENNRFFYKYSDMDTVSLIQNTMIPMLRLGEIYLIAAESQSDELNGGLSYVNTLRKNRGVAGLSALTTDLLTYEYIRELYGEGQLFYYYKRNFATIYNTTNSNGTKPMGRAASTQVFVVPLPDTETNNRQ